MTTDAWSVFGQIEKTVDYSHTIMTLNTHDTTKTWTVKWSGVKAEASSGCGWEISGRLRDISHKVGIPGGVGIGLASFNRRGDPTGLVAQFDYGFSGYRAVTYPSDDTLDLVEADLDRAWHRFDVMVDSGGRLVAVIDGRKVLEAQGAPVCGYPIIRVWAGAAEISSLMVKPHS